MELKTLKSIFTLSIISLSLAGCAANHVSGGLNGDWKGKATLLAGSHISKGDTLFNVSYKDGSLSFPDSPWGPLTGKFTLQNQSVTATSSGIGAVFSNNQTIAVPQVSSTTIKRGDSTGRAYLESNGQVVLLCNISNSFVTTGWMDWEMIGSGVCADGANNLVTILFERSSRK